MPEETVTVKYVGQIPVFPLAQHNPDDSGDCGDPNNLYVVYSSDGNRLICKWEQSAFWYEAPGWDWVLVMNVEYWFRIPTVKELLHA
jgi:hypothetical protein